jgi:hypothetical protein
MQETLEELPHFVTINNYLSNLDPKHLEQIRMQQVKNLIKGRAYEAARLEGKWFVIIDATEICSFEEKNDEFCLHKTYNRGTENEKTIWSHSVLEAKIVLGDHFVISIGSEYIENNAEDEKRQEEMGAEAIKQDCEIKAFRRLAERLKKEFPHLPICIMGDSLYATETLFAICEKYHWDYIIIRDMVYNDIETSHSRANDVIAVKNPTRKTPSIDKYMYTAPHTFLDRLEEFESIWGDINIKKNLVHFLLKYRYVQNWNREVRENYLGYSTDDIINHIDSDKYELIYRKDYVLPFLQKRVYDDFGIFLDTPTHTNLIFKRR